MLKLNLFMARAITLIEYITSCRIYISISPLKLWWDSNGALSFVIKQNMLWKQTMIFLSMFHYSIRLWNTPKKNLLLISTVRSKSYNMRVWVIWLYAYQFTVVIRHILYHIIQVVSKMGRRLPLSPFLPKDKWIYQILWWSMLVIRNSQRVQGMYLYSKLQIWKSNFMNKMFDRRNPAIYNSSETFYF